MRLYIPGIKPDFITYESSNHWRSHLVCREIYKTYIYSLSGIFIITNNSLKRVKYIDGLIYNVIIPTRNNCSTLSDNTNTIGTHANPDYPGSSGSTNASNTSNSHLGTSAIIDTSLIDVSSKEYQIPVPYKEFNIKQCEYTLPHNKLTKFIVVFNQNECYDFYFESQETTKESFINNVTTLLEHLNFC